MRRLLVIFSALFVFSISSCDDGNPDKDGGDQIDAPVLNSGPQVEAERATEQARDSVELGKDSLADGTPR